MNNLQKKPLTFDDLMQVESESPLSSKTLICDNIDPQQILTVALKLNPQKLIQVSNPDFESDLRLSSLLQNHSNSFSKFPLSCIFGLSEMSASSEKELTKLSFSIDSLREKRGILDVIEFHLLEYSAPRDFATKVAFVADELITNAIYNAPGIVSGKNRGKDFSVKVDPNKKPYVFVGHSKNRIILGCRDLYGSLDIQKFLARINECYILTASQALRTGSGGAGVGAYMIYNLASSFYLNVVKGESATICCSFSFERSDKIAKNLFCIDSSRL